jgi:hypothetical protein
MVCWRLEIRMTALIYHVTMLGKKAVMWNMHINHGYFWTFMAYQLCSITGLKGTRPSQIFRSPRSVPGMGLGFYAGDIVPEATGSTRLSTGRC